MAPHAYGRYGRFAGTDAERLADINAAMADDDVDMILCARGGYGLQRIIDRVEGQKTLIGFSDITELHQRSIVPSLHAIMCKHLATLPEDSEPIRFFRQALEGKAITYTIAPHPLNRLGHASGRTVGGNLSVLYGLQATPYGLNHLQDHPILFLEDIAERHYHIDRMMNNLRLSGVLSQISALIVGQFSDCDDDPSMGESIYETILRAVSDYDYPVLFNFPAGHVENNLPIWLHAQTEIHMDAAHAVVSMCGLS